MHILTENINIIIYLLSLTNIIVFALGTFLKLTYENARVLPMAKMTSKQLNSLVMYKPKPRAMSSPYEVSDRIEM